MIRIYLLLLLLIITSTASGQKKWKFQSQNSVGLLEGDAGSSFHIQSVNGFGNKRTFAGIGVGLDYYRLRSVPLFASVQQQLFTKPNSPFIAFDGGVNFAWVDTQPDMWNQFITSKFSPGLFTSGVLGYKMALNANQALIFSAGYSLKKLKEEQEMTVRCFNPPCETSKETYNYNFNRIIVKIGVQL